MRRVRTLIVGTSLLLAALAVPPAVLANDVYVNSMSDSETTPSDGFCTLREAIIATNLNIANTNPDCPDGTGADPDFIRFNTGGTITLTSDLPDITGEVEVDGNGVTIDGADAFRPFRVVSGGLTIRELVLQDGFGGTGFGFGGAISNGAGTIIVDSTIRSSRAGYGGGIHNNGTMTIVSSTIEGNEAETAGGGIFNEGDLTLRNVTVTGNDAPAGAGVYSSDTAKLVHVTIARNAASSGGGGGVNRAGGTLSIQNSVVAGNTGKQLVGAPNHAFSVVQASADGVLDTALRHNGGPARTLGLPAGSPALKIGDPDWCGFAGYVDQRGLARPSGSLARCDAGAVQRDRKGPVMLTRPQIILSADRSLSGTSLRAWLHGWVADEGDGIGVERFVLQRQVNGGAWKTVEANLPARPDTTASPFTGDVHVTLAKDRTYRFRIRAVDEDGNVSGWKSTPTVTARLYQQTNSRFEFSSGWSTGTSKGFSAESVRFTTTDGAWVRMRFTGRAFAFVTTLRTESSATVQGYLDGEPTGTSALGTSEDRYRAQAWAQDWTSSERHVIRYVLVGPGRLDVDAIAVLE